MGRRALPKIDPAIELAQHHYTLETLPQPFSAAELFGRTAPLEVEVGSGKGLFLQNAAATCPERDFLGIEIGTKYARFIAARLAKRGLANAKIIHGDGLKLFHEILPSDSLAAVHVYFPDPWWKARHRKRRVMNEPFLLDVVRVLVPGGRLHFWTDVEEYFTTTLELIAASIPLVGPLPVPERDAEHDLDYHTHFERRKRQAGLPIFRSEFAKAN